MKIEWGKVRLFFINIGTSGKYTEKSEFAKSDYLIRYALMNFISSFGIMILTVFIVINLRKGIIATSAVCGCMVMVCLAALVLARTKLPQIIPASMIMVFYGLLCIAVTWLGEARGASFQFIYMYPLITIMLLGLTYGITLSTVVLAIQAVEMIVPGLSRF